MYDVIIVGGSAAGLSAALILGRFRRNVLVCDHQKPRNAPAKKAHNFFTRDGTPPSELLRIGREQLQAYPTVEYRSTEIVQLTPTDTGFDVQSADGTVYQARRILLATGVRDELPPIPGLAEYWGSGVHHCPYCHGWEVRDQQIVIIGDGEVVSHLAPLLSSLSNDISAVVDNGAHLKSAQRTVLEQMGVTLYESPIESIVGNSDALNGIQLQDGRFVPCQAIFVRPEVHQHSSFASDIGCQADEHGFIKVDPLGRTSVANVYAAGDIVTPFHQIVAASASGATAAGGINTDIAFGGIDSVSH